MSAFLVPTLRLATAGAVIGACMGVASACITHTPPEDLRPVFRHPTKGLRHLDTFALDRDREASIMTKRLFHLLSIDPSVPQSALSQYHVLAYQLQKFFVLWKRYLERTHSTRHKVEWRSQGIRLIKSLKQMENHVWAARELEEIMRVVVFLQDFVTTQLLLHEK